MDARIDAPTWSTVLNFHVGDMLTIWGFTAASAEAWVGEQGALDNTGVTLRAQVNGWESSITFAGLSMNDTRDLVTTFGSIDGQSYLLLTRTA